MAFDKKLNAKMKRMAKKIMLVDYKGGCCSKCGDTRFYVMNFHHLDDSKEFNISGKAVSRDSTLLEEVDKCDLLCANCHQKLHADIKNEKLTRTTTKQACLDYLGVSACKHCSESNIRILNFHHLRDKETEISVMIGNKHIKTKEDLPKPLKEELDKCIVLCPNCHLEEHFNLEFFEKHKEEILKLSKKRNENTKPLDRELVKKMFLDGVKQIEISRYFGCVKSTVCDILKSFGLTEKLENITIDRNKIFELYSLGKTNKEMCEELGCHKSVISRVLLENNLIFNKSKEPIKTNSRKFDPSPEELYELLKTKSYRQIGEMFGVSGVAVYKRKQKFDKQFEK